MKKSKKLKRKKITEDVPVRENPNHVLLSEPDKELQEEIKQQWFNYIADYEEQHKNANYISVREFTGNPSFKPFDEINPSAVKIELDNLFEILSKNNIMLDFCIDYPEEVIYKFITEEFFNHEIMNIRIHGGFTCFSYEEFHPNHDYDLRQYSVDNLEFLFKVNAIKSHLSFCCVQNICLNNNKIFSRDEFAEFILLFHELHKKAVIIDHNITNVYFDLDLNIGKLMMDFNCSLSFDDGGTVHKSEKIIFYYEMKYDCWELHKIDCSLFSNVT